MVWSWKKKNRTFNWTHETKKNNLYIYKRCWSHETVNNKSQNIPRIKCSLSQFACNCGRWCDKDRGNNRCLTRNLPILLHTRGRLLCRCQERLRWWWWCAFGYRLLLLFSSSPGLKKLRVSGHAVDAQALKKTIEQTSALLLSSSSALCVLLCLSMSVYSVYLAFTVLLLEERLEVSVGKLEEE